MFCDMEIGNILEHNSLLRAMSSMSTYGDLWSVRDLFMWLWKGSRRLWW